MLLPVIAGMLLCGCVAAELPELLSLADNTSNDFTIRQPGSRECASMLSAANHELISADMKDPEFGTHLRHSATLRRANHLSPELVVLYVVFRT
jgi:hypothetical protein